MVGARALDARSLGERGGRHLTRFQYRLIRFCFGGIQPERGKQFVVHTASVLVVDTLSTNVGQELTSRLLCVQFANYTVVF